MTPELFKALVDAELVPYLLETGESLGGRTLRLAMSEGGTPRPIGYVVLEAGMVTREIPLDAVGWRPFRVVTHDTPAGEPERIEYRSCDIVLELYVTWSGPRGRCLEFVLAQLPPELLYDHAGARAYVAPFVEAVKQQDPRALEELRRALRWQRDRRVLVSDTTQAPDSDWREAMYDATVVR